MVADGEQAHCQNEGKEERVAYKLLVVVFARFWRIATLKAIVDN